MSAPRASPVGERTAWQIPAWAGVLTIAALWFVSRPYRGVRHDAILYIGQILGRLMPNSIGRDLFLAYGSQDRYSMFSTLVAPLLRHGGVAGVEMGLLLVCQAAFMLACWWLTQALPSRNLRWCALLLLVSLAHTYAGGDGTLAFAEPFLTARSLAEPLALFAIGLAVRARVACAALALLVALALHALIALPAALVIWVLLCLRDRRWVLAAVIPVLAALAGAAGIAPFSGLWRAFDPAWWAGVSTMNSLVFIASTSAQDWGTALLNVLVLHQASRLLAGKPLATLLRAMLICVPIVIVAWAVGADMLHDVLLTQLQLWRLFWLTHLFTLLLIPLVLAHLWQRGTIGRWAAAAMGLAALAVSANLSTVLLCDLWALVPLALLRFEVAVSRQIAWLAVVVSALAALTVSAIVAWRTHAAVAAFPDRFNGTSDLQVLLGVSAVTATVGYALLRGLASTGARRLIAMTVLAAIGVSAGAWWDQRSDWQRFVENGLEEKDLPFQGKVPPSATVYWDESLLEPWLLMQRQQFFMHDQASGLLFSRDTALHFMARQEVIRPLLVQRQLCGAVAALTGRPVADCEPAVDDIRSVCRTPGGPDFMVFRRPPDSDSAGADATWHYRPGDVVRGRTYRLYDCAHLR